MDKDQHHHSGSPACVRSVTVHWNVPKEPSPAVAPEATSSHPEESQVPVPLPRSKQPKQPAAEESKCRILVQLGENRDAVASDPGETGRDKSLNEPLEVFTLSNEPVENSDSAATGRVTGGEDAGGEMSNNHRNIQARIQAFESQGGPAEAAKPAEPEPRKVTNRPPVAAKPSVALQAESDHSGDNGSLITGPPAPAPKPQLPKKPAGLSLKEQLEELHSKGTASNRLHPPELTRSSCVYDQDSAPVPPAKPAKEPLKPNLNINNHNSTSVLQDNQGVRSASSE